MAKCELLRTGFAGVRSQKGVKRRVREVRKACGVGAVWVGKREEDTDRVRDSFNILICVSFSADILALSSAQPPLFLLEPHSI